MKKENNVKILLEFIEKLEKEGKLTKIEKNIDIVKIIKESRDEIAKS